MFGLVKTEEKPIVNNKGGKVLANSLDIAEQFGKNHFDIVRAIKNLDCTPEFNACNFTGVKYSDKKGEERTCYDITRDGFSFLIMGFTGKKAALWKEKYISAFNMMEQELTKPNKELSPEQIVQQALLITTEQVKALEYKIEEDKPKVEFFDKHVEHEGNYNLRTAGKMILGKPQKFIDSLKGNYVFYENKALVPYTKYLRDGIFATKISVVNEHERVQTYVTPKGMRYFADKYGHYNTAEGALALN